jgi:lipopolysaccharide export system protein LptA
VRLIFRNKLSLNRKRAKKQKKNRIVTMIEHRYVQKQLNHDRDIKAQTDICEYRIYSYLRLVII